MATHSSILAWRIPWTEEPGGLYSLWDRSQSRHHEATDTLRPALVVTCGCYTLVSVLSAWLKKGLSSSEQEGLTAGTAPQQGHRELSSNSWGAISLRCSIVHTAASGWNQPGAPEIGDSGHDADQTLRLVKARSLL